MRRIWKTEKFFFRATVNEKTTKRLDDVMHGNIAMMKSLLMSLLLVLHFPHLEIQKRGTNTLESDDFIYTPTSVKKFCDFSQTHAIKLHLQLQLSQAEKRCE